MTDILVFSEQEQVALELLSKARELGTPVAAVLGADVTGRANELLAYGAKKVYLGQDARLANPQADVYAQALAQIAQVSGAGIILIGSTRRGKELAGRLAQTLGCGAVTDAIGLATAGGKLAAQRYALGGNTIATDVITSERQVIAVLPKTFEASKAPVAGELVQVDLKLPEARVHVVETKPKAKAAANIEEAERLVVVGKGFAKQEDLGLAERLAQALHAEIGCTRALSADYHWLSEERMIGVSGKKCKPQMVVSIGISGQIQHTVGILASKLIVAINKDKAAPIFKIADYGIVGDLYQVTPRLTERLKAK